MRTGNITLMRGAAIRNFRPEILASDPDAGTLSQETVRLWWNSTDSKLRLWDGATIEDIAIGGNLEDYIRHDGTVAMTADLELSGTDQSGSADTAAVSKGYMATLLAAKEDVIDGAASTIAHADLGVQKAVVTDANGKIVEATATAGEIDFLSGVTSGIQAQIDGKQDNLGYTPLDVAGSQGGMQVNLAMNGNKVTGLLDGDQPTDAVTYSQFENALAGIQIEGDVLGMQVDNALDVSGAVEGDRYIIGDAANLHASFGTIDGVTTGDIVHFVGGAWEIDLDIESAGTGSIVIYDNGAAYYRRWNGSAWARFGGLEGVTAGNGLYKDADTLHINMGAGVAQLPDDEVGIDVRLNSGLMLTEDGATDSVATGAQLALKVDGATVAVDANGVKVADQGITEVQLAASVAGDGLAGGAGSALSITAGDGIVVTADGVELDEAHTDTIYARQDGAAFTGPVTVLDATAAQEPVAKNQLDAAVTALNDSVTEVNDRLTGSFYAYDGLSTATTTHTITHNLGDARPQVQVSDADGKVVQPDEITFIDANTLEVSLAIVEGIYATVQAAKAQA